MLTSRLCDHMVAVLVMLLVLHLGPLEFVSCGNFSKFYQSARDIFLFNVTSRENIETWYTRIPISFLRYSARNHVSTL